ncbi:MAG: hypothetical protein LUD57_04250 [Ruminococcus sp.]|nr:hypothetical protein [Ruminococcus sp.]MCD7811475.1 hypothetical protein [Ruminococcus sp.]MCD8187817.1 hypothetical protein [Ruminococcus sp.]
MKEKFYTYKGYPLVRNGNTLYYGYMSDPYVIMMEIVSTKSVGNEKIADKVRVVQMSTAPNADPLKIFVKNTECEGGLYEALDVARVWLGKAMKG